jgi:hypothetical protein
MLPCMPCGKVLCLKISLLDEALQSTYGQASFSQ